MTKKHFIELADRIKAANERRESAFLPPMFDIPAIESLADFCQRQNHNFKRDRWIAYINGECGKNGGSIK